VSVGDPLVLLIRHCRLSLCRVSISVQLYSVANPWLLLSLRIVAAGWKISGVLPTYSERPKTARDVFTMRSRLHPGRTSSSGIAVTSQTGRTLQSCTE